MRAVGACPDGQSALMLVAGQLRYVMGTHWDTQRYPDMEHLETPEEIPLGL